MGYSEIHCHLCGVSFNIARIRTIGEPRSHAWKEYGTNQSTFIAANEYAWDDKYCNDSTGCQIVFREDNIPHEEEISSTYNDVLHRLQVLQSRGSPDQASYQSLSISEEDDSKDDDFDPEGSSEAEACDDDIMDYEFEEPRDKCGENLPGEAQIVDKQDFEAGMLYTDWLRDTTQLIIEHCTVSSSTNMSKRSDEKRAQAADRVAQSILANPNKELMLPLYKPDSSDQGDYLMAQEPGSRPTSPQKRSLSFVNHRLNAGHRSNLYEIDEARHWEHIAGPGCTQPRGYSGSQITFDEMKSICTSQCLYEDYGSDEEGSTDDDADDDADNDQKSAPNFKLSGLCHAMPSRDDSSPDYDERYAADNYVWEHDLEGDETLAMPFHPACLEVYKRICLRNQGSVNLAQLGGWWRIVSIEYEAFERIPRDEAVSKADEQWWSYNAGDEWLAANPCLVPNLKRILEAVTTEAQTRQTTARQPGFQQDARNTLVSSFANLPTDVLKVMLDHLSAIDLANLSLAMPSLDDLISPLIRSALIDDYPYLWELWCDARYPEDVGMNGVDVRLFQEATEPKSEEAQRIDAILREEGFDDLADVILDEHHRLEAEAIHELQRSVMTNEAECVQGKEVDYVHLALALHEALSNDRLKGLRNRARIWKDCSWILEDIERLKEEGKLLLDGKISPETWQELEGQGC